MSSRFVPFPLCPSDWFSSFPVRPLLPVQSLCPFLSLLCLLFPPCVPWVMPSQLSNVNLSIILSENLSLTISHSPIFPTPLPTPTFQRAVIALIAPHASFPEYLSQLQFYICLCHYSIHTFISSSDCRLCESRKHTCLCSPLCPPCLVQGQLIVDSVYICGIDRLWDIWLGKCVDFHCYSPVIDLTQFDSSIFWFGSTLHCLPPPTVSSLLILSSSKAFFLKDCTHSFMHHISVTHSDQHHI